MSIGIKKEKTHLKYSANKHIIGGVQNGKIGQMDKKNGYREKNDRAF